MENKNRFGIFAIVFLIISSTIVLAYTAPSPDNVELILASSYTAPSADNILLQFGEGEGTAPAYDNFASDEDTTNFSDVADITNVTNLTLAVTNKGKIRFAEESFVNADGANFDANVVIEDSFIFVNTSALDSTFNNSATLTFENVDCGFPYVYYSDSAGTSYDLLAEDNQCLAPRCTNIQCSGTTLTVDVAHFSGYSANGTTNLSIDADDPKFILEDATFTAIYMNDPDGFLNESTCNIHFPGESPIQMDEQADHYNYTKAFATPQTVDYNVTCSKIGYNTVFADDNASILSPDIPEFSVLTLGLGLIAVLIGLVIIRRRK